MGHAHDDHDATTDTGPAEIPAEPTTRSITPAAEDFASTPPLHRLLWPVLWIGLTVAIAAPLLALVHDRGWITVNPDDHGDAHEGGEAAGHAD